MTILLRSPVKSSALASAFRPAVTEAVTATSSGWAAAHSLVLHHPDVPVRAYRQPVFKILLEGVADRNRQRAIGAAVQIGLALQERELLSERAEI